MYGFDPHLWDYAAFALYFIVLSGVGWWSGHQRKSGSE